MKRFKKILVYVGGEVAPTPAIERASALAASNEAKLTLADVLPEEPTGPWMTQPGRAELERMLVVARREELEDLAAPLRRRGIGVEVRVFTGRPFVELIREVRRGGYELILKTAQGLDGAIGGALGSTALHLLRKCPCPVWVVKPSDEVRGRVVAAIDPDPERRGDDVLSRTVLELSASLARMRGLELEIVHAWNLWPESMLRSRRLNMAPAEVDEIVAKTEQAARAAVHEVVGRIDLGDLSHRIRVLRGRPFEVIAESTREADVAVLGTLSRAGIAGVLIGNTAERVLRQIDCSVIAVKPAGFETPVQLPVEEH